MVHLSVGFGEFGIFVGLCFEVEFEFGDDLVDLLDFVLFGVDKRGVFVLYFVHLVFHFINKFLPFSKRFL